VHAHLLSPWLLAEALLDRGTRRKVLRGKAERPFGLTA
jgi:hypothetical protein